LHGGDILISSTDKTYFALHGSYFSPTPLKNTHNSNNAYHKTATVISVRFFCSGSGDEKASVKMKIVMVPKLTNPMACRFFEPR